MTKRALKICAGVIRKTFLTRKYYLKSNKGKKIILDIGGNSSTLQNGTIAGLPHPIWKDSIILSVNIDYRVCPIIVDNAVTLGRLSDEIADGLYSSHTIEHISQSESKKMFKNWYRVLKYGGRIEIRCPDIEWTWKEYFKGNMPEEIITELMLGISSGQYQYHRNMYWESKLIGELNEAGFIKIKRIDYNYTIPHLDYWLYDGKYTQYHGRMIKDLLIEAYK